MTRTHLFACRTGRYLAGVAALVLVLGAALVAEASARPPGGGSRPCRSSSFSTACAIYGVTVDDPSRLADLTSAERALPRRITTRLVFDVGSSVVHYRPAVKAFSAHGFLLGGLLDSDEERQISAAAEHARVAAYLAAYREQVNVWEIGNEVNGNWTGPYPEVAAKLIDAYNQVKAAHGLTALTVFANDLGPDHCGDGTSELSPAQFATRYLPASLRNGLSYVLVSYYEQNCGGLRPSTTSWTHYLRALHRLFPHAKLGFGEVGLIHAATPATLAYAKSVMSYYYGLSLRLPYFVKGDFWWYFAEDARSTAQPLWRTLAAALRR